MKYVRVKSYYNGKWNGTEHLYSTCDHVYALERFKKDYPHYTGKCILVAETINGDDSDEYIQVARRCGCID